MLEYPAIGSSVDIELKENMVISYHPQVVDQEGTVCLYTQDTFRVGQQAGENLTEIPWQLYRGGELPPNG
jgi:Xaa-Pro aminopeptidase